MLPDDSQQSFELVKICLQIAGALLVGLISSLAFGRATERHRARLAMDGKLAEARLNKVVEIVSEIERLFITGGYHPYKPLLFTADSSAETSSATGITERESHIELARGHIVLLRDTIPRARVLIGEHLFAEMQALGHLARASAEAESEKESPRKKELLAAYKVARRDVAFYLRVIIGKEKSRPALDEYWRLRMGQEAMSVDHPDPSG